VFSPTIDFFPPEKTAEAQSQVGTPVAGIIGTYGDWTSLVIKARAQQSGFPKAPFRFQAVASYEKAAPGRTYLATDSAPNSREYANYP